MTRQYEVDRGVSQRINELMRMIKQRLSQKDGSPLNPRRISRELQRLVLPNEDTAEKYYKAKDDLEKKLFPAFSALVDYTQPSLDELNRRFDQVSENIGASRFEARKPYKNVNRAKRVITFEIFYPDSEDSLHDDGVSTKVVLTAMKRKGLRPALYEELLGFHKKFPDAGWDLIALGSVTHNKNGEICVAILCDRGEHQVLELTSFSDDWSIQEQFLSVREEA